MRPKGGFEVEKHLGESWYSLQRYEGDTFSARVKPLSENEIEMFLGKLTGNNEERLGFADWLRNDNSSILAASKKVAIVLDGRSKESPQGFLGDMIEATRMVNAIRSTGRRVIIATPHADLFAGNHDPSIGIVNIPEDVPASHTAPWNTDLLQYLEEAIGDAPCLFPMNATTPALIQLASGGVIKNYDTLSLIKEAFRTNGKNPRITPLQWGKYGIHQLQAFQITSHLLGIDSAKKWEAFPEAFFNPDKEARKIAREVVKSYGCFEVESEQCPPLYLHPGVATNGSKLITKFYPENRWIQFINNLSGAPYTTSSLTFLEPTDKDQAAMTLRLATQAIEAGLKVSKVPMSAVKQQYGWNLGSFVSFLRELANHRGIIVGCDSMPAGHAGPAAGSSAVVLGSHCFNPGFYCPPDRALVVLPSNSAYTSEIEPERVLKAVQNMCRDPQFLNSQAS